ncbi:MAG: hypothetical protein V7752_15300 [Halopseudomonas sp.]
MNQQAEYRQGSVGARVAVLLLMVVAVGMFFYLQGIISQILIDIQMMIDSSPQMALTTISRLLLWLVVSSGLMSVAIGFYVCAMAVRIAKGGVYPPAEMPVIFKTPLQTGRQAQKMRRNCLLLAGLLFLQPLLGMAIWYGLSGGVI